MNIKPASINTGQQVANIISKSIKVITGPAKINIGQLEYNIRVILKLGEFKLILSGLFNFNNSNNTISKSISKFNKKPKGKKKMIKPEFKLFNN